MPAIAEEEDPILAAPDFSDLLDVRQDALAGDGANVFTTSLPTEPVVDVVLEDHPNPVDDLDLGLLGAWDLPEPSTDPYAGLEEPDYTRFENWIPRFIRPQKPCDYCHSRRLVCYITRGEAGCTPCSALFRECSLTNSQPSGLPDPRHQLTVDTLHVVDEDAPKLQGTLTGFKPLKSKSYPSAANDAVRPDDAPGSSKRNGIRFPRHAVKVLRDWLDSHASNPYPTEEEKVDLQRQTDLTPTQITNWLANARRRRKVTEKSRPSRSSSPFPASSTPAIAIPRADKPWDELSPFERWKHSPPEHEPASITDIASAVANSDLPDEPVSASPSTQGKRRKRSSNSSGLSHPRAPSATSFETGQSSSHSASTGLFSQGSSRSLGSFGSFSSSLAGKKDRRRRRRPVSALKSASEEAKKRIFQCTFCTDTFKSKYDWTRHEKSLHLSLEKWICHPIGPVITDPTTGNKRCVYCDVQNPPRDHEEVHNHRQCDEKGIDARTFYRKDHLRQHLRLMHNCEMTPFMENWKSTSQNINSRCGFCAQRFKVWTDRVDHLTAHFKAGARMSDWKGCRGLDPAVAAQVTNAMPPYLIGMESVSPNPFSATNKATWRQVDHLAPEFTQTEGVAQGNMTDRQPSAETLDTSTRATCWEILTVRLGKFANEMVRKGVVITDDMLQSQARRLLYDSDDTWNQTSADNPEWLDLFKKAHGLDFIPTAIGGQGTEVPEDLETYGDLGLRIPFAVQLQALNQIEAKAAQETQEKARDVEMSRMWRELAAEGVLHGPGRTCEHEECQSNLAPRPGQTALSPGGSYRTWCTYELPPERAKRLAALTASSGDSGVAGQPLNTSNMGHEASLPAMTGPRAGKQSLGGAAARAQGLMASAAAEAPLMDGSDEGSSSSQQPYLQRYQLELPPERAQRFATTTGTWQQAGLMPEPTNNVMLPTIDPHDTTTTGAMMEFLGGDVGKDLPFSSDAATSAIPLSGFDWNMPLDAADQAAMIDDIDQLIAETTQAQAQNSTMASMYAAEPFGAPGASDSSMRGLQLDDMELNFDGVFDMPMDDTFYQ